MSEVIERVVRAILSASSEISDSQAENAADLAFPSHLAWTAAIDAILKEPGNE